MKPRRGSAALTLVGIDLTAAAWKVAAGAGTRRDHLGGRRVGRAPDFRRFDGLPRRLPATNAHVIRRSCRRSGTRSRPESAAYDAGEFQAVVAVPSWWTLYQRWLVATAARAAGVRLLRIVPAGAAAAFAYAITALDVRLLVCELDESRLALTARR
ncbi:MAG: Hsp70 family protein [Dehalococcoidia bacterium]